MLVAERRQEILSRLDRDGRVEVSELVTRLRVSEDTIRRDLHELAARGLLYRVHGGALASAPEALPFDRRLELAREEKIALADAALPLLEPGTTLILDGGTTALEVARRLPPNWHGSIVTNAPPVAAALAIHPRADVTMVGGRLLKDQQVAVGPVAVDAFRAIRADVCVLGVCALDSAAGVTTPNEEEAHVNRAMIAGSDRVIALATQDKLQATNPWVVARLDEIHVLVTDGGRDLTGAFSKSGIVVVTP